MHINGKSHCRKTQEYQGNADTDKAKALVELSAACGAYRGSGTEKHFVERDVLFWCLAGGARVKNAAGIAGGVNKAVEKDNREEKMHVAAGNNKEKSAKCQECR